MWRVFCQPFAVLYRKSPGASGLDNLGASIPVQCSSLEHQSATNARSVCHLLHSLGVHRCTLCCGLCVCGVGHGAAPHFADFDFNQARTSPARHATTPGRGRTGLGKAPGSASRRYRLEFEMPNSPGLPGRLVNCDALKRTSSFQIDGSNIGGIRLKVLCLCDSTCPDFTARFQQFNPGRCVSRPALT